jgi:hypothetical protein
MPDDPKPDPPKPPTFAPITVDGSAWNPANWAQFVTALGSDRFIQLAQLGIIIYLCFRPAPQNLDSGREFAGIRRCIHAQVEIDQAAAEAFALSITETDTARRQKAADKLTAEVARQTDTIHQAFREE